MRQLTGELDHDRRTKRPVVRCELLGVIRGTCEFYAGGCINGNIGKKWACHNCMLGLGFDTTQFMLDYLCQYLDQLTYPNRHQSRETIPDIYLIP